jgi:hypothetical protein
VVFSFELVYAGVFRIVNVPKENLHPLVMIECPRLLFPFAREIIATSVRDGGFPPLLLDLVDFVGLYRQNMERQAAEWTSGRAARGESSRAGRSIMKKPDRAIELVQIKKTAVAQAGSVGLLWLPAIPKSAWNVDRVKRAQADLAPCGHARDLSEDELADPGARER